MKPSMILVSAGLVSGLAQAQSVDSVQLYGILDVGVRTQTGLNASFQGAPDNSRIAASGIGPTSRWGLRGTENLGGGLKASFNLESGLNVMTGAQGNATAAFDRAAVLGLSGDWGSLTVGRQNTLVADSAGSVDPIGLRFAALNPNIQVTSLTGHRLGIEFGVTGSSGASNRVNQSVKYAKSFGAVTGRAFYGFGNAQGTGSRSSTQGLGLDWAQGPWLVTSAYTRFHDTNGRTLDAGNLGAAWRQGDWRLTLNLGHNKGQTSATATTTNRIVAAGVNYAVTPQVDLLAGYYHVDRTRTGLVDDGYGRFMLFAEYKLSKRTRLFAEFDHTRWRGGYQGTGNKGTASGLSLGITHSF